MSLKDEAAKAAVTAATQFFVGMGLTAASLVAVGLGARSWSKLNSLCSAKLTISSGDDEQEDEITRRPKKVVKKASRKETTTATAENS